MVTKKEKQQKEDIFALIIVVIGILFDLSAIWLLSTDTIKITTYDSVVVELFMFYVYRFIGMILVLSLMPDDGANSRKELATLIISLPVFILLVIVVIQLEQDLRDTNGK